MQRPRQKDYLKLVAQKAWQTWRKLPVRHRVWIDVDDLLQEGLLFARLHVLPRYRANRGTKFTTYLSACLDNFYCNLLTTAFSKKRRETDVVPLLSVQHVVYEDRMEIQLSTVEALKKILSSASPPLRRYLCHWLLFHGNMHCGGPKFAAAKDEFLELAGSVGLDRQGFQSLLHTTGWQQKIFRPYLVE